MRFIVMFVTAVCVLFLIKLRWPKKNNFYVVNYYMQRKSLYNHDSSLDICTRATCVKRSLASFNQCGANNVTVALWLTKSQPWMLVAWNAAFLENNSAVSVLILNRSSIECHEIKLQPFSFSGVRFVSPAILISG